MKRKLYMLLLLLVPLTALAGDGADEKKTPGILKPVMWLKTLIDSMAVATIDRSYIEQPKRPWAVELRNEFNESTLKMNSDFPTVSGKNGNITTETSSGFTTSVGLWAGYRGYGLGWSKELTGGLGSTLSFGAMGGSFGINFRINRYKSDTPKVKVTYDDKDTTFDLDEKMDLDDPISVRSLFLDGYYMFNGRHFSYAAAYDQSLRQRRSAGSLMAGAMYYHSSIDYTDQSNWPLVAFMQGVGKLKFTQACVGLGYAYNWVPARGWLISAQAMPMLQFYNKISAYTYRFKLLGEDITDLVVFDFGPDDEGSGDDDGTDELVYELIELSEDNVVKTHNRIGWNFDARLAVVYNWERFYLRVYGHYNRFRYSNDMGHGRMSEWRAYASLGFRF